MSTEQFQGEATHLGTSEGLGQQFDLRLANAYVVCD